VTLAKLSGIDEENIMYTKVSDTDNVLKQPLNVILCSLQLARTFMNTSIMQIDGLQWFDKPATMEDNHTLSGAPDGSVYLFK
jgi:hypothetical protein